MQEMKENRLKYGINYRVKIIKLNKNTIIIIKIKQKEIEFNRFLFQNYCTYIVLNHKKPSIFILYPLTFSDLFFFKFLFNFKIKTLIK